MALLPTSLTEYIEEYTQPSNSSSTGSSSTSGGGSDGSDSGGSNGSDGNGGNSSSDGNGGNGGLGGIRIISTSTGDSSSSTEDTSTNTGNLTYSGGNQVISDYTSGQKIIFEATFTAAAFDGLGNFVVSSNLGTLAIQNVRDKVIDLSTSAGNSFVTAYEASTAGVIDGRSYAGYEYITGSAAGGNVIYAGNSGSQLWGGSGAYSDILVGGNGADLFIGGKYQGADYFLNAAATDAVFLNDALLSDITATAEENGTIGIAFNTGNVIAIQSSEALSAAVILADGSAYRYNHVTKSWQGA